ncbi:anti-anti-sigma factor [Synechococcus sp. PCC 7502]|uniref:anti-sigma factor antagonist n=1 Tax=Synechococcus sp. PCC 7502 TaxID=1173263 RepID=UPI00029F999E|nr:anti-sigma factor antagonist [Synechococcus sp. PCC 7502]AFY75010.1 anti-anti-sigma factor [Synechococcus sp. PCC 7502]
MTFTATLEIIDDVAKITLAGELDAATAPVLKVEVEKAAEHKVKKLVLFAHDLEYMASAGLRVLLFSKQKMGVDVDIYVVGAQEFILETLEKTGFAQSVILVDKYED